MKGTGPIMRETKTGINLFRKNLQQPNFALNHNKQKRTVHQRPIRDREEKVHQTQRNNGPQNREPSAAKTRKEKNSTLQPKLNCEIKRNEKRRMKRSDHATTHQQTKLSPSPTTCAKRTDSSHQVINHTTTRKTNTSSCL